MKSKVFEAWRAMDRDTEVAPDWLVPFAEVLIGSLSHNALEAPAPDDRDAEERRAWDMYAAAWEPGRSRDHPWEASMAAAYANALLTARRARFPKGPDQ